MCPELGSLPKTPFVEKTPLTEKKNAVRVEKLFSTKTRKFSSTTRLQVYHVGCTFPGKKEPQEGKLNNIPTRARIFALLEPVYRVSLIVCSVVFGAKTSFGAAPHHPIDHNRLSWGGLKARRQWKCTLAFSNLPLLKHRSGGELMTT